ncbi:MAG: hypothetical protein JRI23_34965 [Deltaproteobacteria bacterium]|jgi:Cys-rich repeat protein|nr:hypothetical protein [Deltaproteobacteria bacterium]MBW2537509.1 hypothetical protein [Deltaproteobacteria bacterium]
MQRVGWIVVIAFVTVALSSMAACRTSRFPTCETDEQCAQKEGGTVKPYCVNVRCVQCRNDADCKGGEICNLRTKECNKL